MQTDTKALVRQQLILKQLGFYTGPLDGIWGPVTIEAMRKFENRLDMFRPARPRGGLPFADGDKLPHHFWMQGGLLCHECLKGTDEQEAQAVEAAGERPKRRKSKFDTAQSVIATEDLKIEIEDPSQVSQSKTSHHGKNQKHNQRRDSEEAGE